MREEMANSFPVEVDGKQIGRVYRTRGGRWVPKDIYRWAHGEFATPAEARTALIQAVETWEARDIAKGRHGRSYGRAIDAKA